MFFLRPAFRRFGDASDPKGNIEHLGPLGAGVSVAAPLPERLPGLIEGSSRPQSSFECGVPGSKSSWGQPFQGSLSRGPPSLTVEGTQFQDGGVVSPCRISRSEPALAQEAVARDIPSCKPKFPARGARFSCSLGLDDDSRQADHYAQYLSVPQRRAAGCGGPKSPRKPSTC